MTARNAAPGPLPACPDCASGSLQPRRVVFARSFQGHLLVLPNFPGWVCDVCGNREYEPAALEQLQLLLGAEAELRRPSGRRAPAQAPRVPPARPHGRRLV